LAPLFFPLEIDGGRREPEAESIMAALSNLDYWIIGTFLARLCQPSAGAFSGGTQGTGGSSQLKRRIFDLMPANDQQGTST